MQSLVEASLSGLAHHGDGRFSPLDLWMQAAGHGGIALAFVAAAIAVTRAPAGSRTGVPSRAIALVLLLAALLNIGAIGASWSPVAWLPGATLVASALASLGAAWALWRLSRGGEPITPAAPGLAAASPPSGDPDRVEALIRERDAALAERAREAALREQAEDGLVQARQLEAVGRLAGGVAHDFNNLLQAVAGNLELIARKPDDADRVVRWSGSALDAVERGRALVGQLLAFSRKQRVQITSTRLTALVAGVRDLLERAVAPLGQVEIEPIDPTLNVQADALQLELAMLNLAFSARDAMPDGGVLTVGAERRRDAPGLPTGDYVALTLRSSTGAANPDATGLSMAEGVLAQMGGALLAEEGEGQRWRVTLFLRVATSEPVREVQDDAAADERIELNGWKIALVDDDAQVRATLAETLGSAGADVMEASDGVEGLELVARVQPDMLVVDFGMPGMSGAEVVRQVRADHPRLPVLLVSGLAELAAVEAVRGPGIGVLQKPFEAQQLLRAVKALVAR